MPELKDDADYVSFGDVARDQCNEQCQYASRYLDGRHGFPNLGEGIRIKGSTADYHFLLIHKDDVAEFVKRVLDYRKATGMIP